MGVKSRNRRRTKTRDLVVDISGTGFAGPEQHSTAVSAWESPCEEKEKRSVLGSLVSALLRPCCGSSRDVVAPRSKTKVKRIKQYKTAKVSLAINCSVCLILCAPWWHLLYI